MTSAVRTPGHTTLPHRNSWGAKSATPTKVLDRSTSGNFDRIINAFEKTNSFELIQGTERFVAHRDVIVNRDLNKCSSFDRADSGLATKITPCTEDEVTSYYREKILFSQARQLFPLQEDLAEWINKTIGTTYLTGENFLDVIDNGVELCQLATVVQEKAKESQEKGVYDGIIPTLRGRCWQRAARRSFFSRDNVENFILFCRQLGVHENLLFESDDLVLHAQPRQVILCLLELARLVSKFGVEPPGLVQLEREIALEEHDSGLDSGLDLGWQFRETSPEVKTKDEASQTVKEDQNESEDSVKTDDSGEESIEEPPKPLTDLDKRVHIMTRLMQRNCNCSSGKCSKLVKVKKVGEGRYNIAGRNVFIRLLKGRHMMVRVGGGWDTLEHFLSRHDACQVRLIHATTPTHMQAYTLPIHQTAAIPRRKSLASSASSASGRSSPSRVTPTSSRANSVSGDNSPTSSCSGKISQQKHSSKLKKSMSLPIKETLNDVARKLDQAACGTQIKSIKTTKKSMTLPLKTINYDSKIPRRKQTLAPSLSVPTTPSTKPRPFNESKKTPCSSGPVKKTRSMSFATATPPQAYPLTRASSANVRTLISPADIEKSIRMSLSHLPECSSIPFLHIKAKYRSPSPRETPPR